MDLAALKAELTTDPLVRGYAGMTDVQAAASLNAADRSVPVRTLTSAQIFNAIVPAEFTSLSTAEKGNVDRVLGLGADIDVSAGTNARTVMLNAFVAGTATRTALAALTARTVSRAEELGLPVPSAGHVATARRV